jgi:hypothetical protein
MLEKEHHIIRILNLLTQEKKKAQAAIKQDSICINGFAVAAIKKIKYDIRTLSLYDCR